MSIIDKVEVDGTIYDIDGGGSKIARFYFVSDEDFEGYKVEAIPLIGNTTKEVTLDENGEGYLDVDGLDRYTVNLYHMEAGVKTIDYTVHVDASVGDFHYINVGLSTNTWAGIKRIIDAGRAQDFISNGDQFTVELSTGETLIYEANVNAYGLGEVDFIPSTCLTETRQMPSQVGWAGSSARQWLNSTFLSTLPVDLQRVISEKTVKSPVSWNVTSIETTLDKIWLPSLKELNFDLDSDQNWTFDRNDVAYPIFTNASSRVRGLGSGGATSYHTTSHRLNYYSFAFVTTSGGYNGNDSNESYGILPCFRIAPTQE